jgi:hypothetical protein
MRACTRWCSASRASSSAPVTVMTRHWPAGRVPGGSGCCRHPAAHRCTGSERRRRGVVRPIAESDRLSYTVVRILSSKSAARCHALVEAGCVAPLVALLSSTTAEVQSQAAGALCNISADVTSAALIVAHGGAPLLRLPAKHATMTFASVALRNVRAAAEPLRVGSVDPVPPGAAADSDSVVVAAAALRALPDVTLAAPLPCGALAGASSPPPPPPAVSVAVALCRPRAM